MLKAVYALVGADVFLQLNKQAELLKQAPIDAQRFEIDGERAELSQVLDEVRSPAMFGGRKIVAVRNAEGFIGRFREAVEKYLASPVDSATLILRCERLAKSSRIYRLVEQVGEVHVCEPPIELMNRIMGQAKCDHGMVLTRDCARLLADMVGPDFARLSGELARLATCANGKRITPGDIAGTGAFQTELAMIELTNALSAGDAERAVGRWRALMQLAPAVEPRLFTWLDTWLSNVQKCLKMKRDGRGTYDICREARIWCRDLQDPFIQTMSALGEEGVDKALAQLADLEYQSRTGLADVAGNVERFLASLKLKAE